MIIIADSGSTKTEWSVVKNNRVLHTVLTAGLNPYFVTTRDVAEVVSTSLIPVIAHEPVESIFFYGSGCSTPDKKKVIDDALRESFPEAQTGIEHDIMGAARALFQDKPGIACILGTGSNSCLYDGKQIRERNFSAGYIFGDEGSGAVIGKIFMTEYLKDRPPREIIRAFDETCGLTREQILNGVYKEANPNRFLASFTRFLKEHISHPWVHKLMESCFDDFFKEQVSRYTGYKTVPLGCIGSVGYHFSDLIRHIAQMHGVKTGSFEISPMQGLLRYHRSGD